HSKPRVGAAGVQFFHLSRRKNNTSQPTGDQSARLVLTRTLWRRLVKGELGGHPASATWPALPRSSWSLPARRGHLSALHWRPLRDRAAGLLTPPQPAEDRPPGRMPPLGLRAKALRPAAPEGPP